MPPAVRMTKPIDDAVLELASLVIDDLPRLSDREAELAGHIADVIEEWLIAAQDEEEEEED